MRIDKTSQWIIYCDNCGDMEEVVTGDSGVFNKSDAIKEFRIRKWKIGNKYICPKCNAFVENGEVKG